MAARGLDVVYCVEPRQNIALARNKAVENAQGDFIAFIDDDEFPTPRWLLFLFRTHAANRADGVLGPVRCRFDEVPPKWVFKSKLYDRPAHPTGHVLHWRETRTGNVLFRRSILLPGEQVFRPAFRMGEDQDFFRRMMDRGHSFVWCNEAVVYEVVPPSRWKHSYILRRSMLGGAMEPSTPTFRARDLGKALLAVPTYALALPAISLLGHHRFMECAAKLAYHLGTVLAYLGFNPIRTPYITE